MPGSTTLPLYLFQVLEEEFISLHSTTPLKTEVVSLPALKGIWNTAQRYR